MRGDCYSYPASILDHSRQIHARRPLEIWNLLSGNLGNSALCLRQKKCRDPWPVALAMAAGVLNMALGTRSTGGFCLAAALYLSVTRFLRNSAGQGVSTRGRSMSLPSGEKATRTKNTGIPFFRNAAARAAPFFTTLAAAWGAVCRPTTPFWRSITTSAVFALSINALFMPGILPSCMAARNQM